jgi:hypothetical protein
MTHSKTSHKGQSQMIQDNLFMLFGLGTKLMYELILYLNFCVKSKKTFQHSFKRLKVKKLVHNVLTFYRFNNHDARAAGEGRSAR